MNKCLQLCFRFSPIVHPHGWWSRRLAYVWVSLHWGKADRWMWERSIIFKVPWLPGVQLSTGIDSTTLQYFHLRFKTVVQTNNLGKWSSKTPEKFKILQDKLNPTWTILLGVQLLWKQLPVQRPTQAVLHRMSPSLQTLRAKRCRLESIAWYIPFKKVLQRLDRNGRIKILNRFSILLECDFYPCCCCCCCCWVPAPLLVLRMNGNISTIWLNHLRLVHLTGKVSGNLV